MPKHDPSVEWTYQTKRSIRSIITAVHFGQAFVQHLNERKNICPVHEKTGHELTIDSVADFHRRRERQNCADNVAHLMSDLCEPYRSFEVAAHGIAGFVGSMVLISRSWHRRSSKNERWAARWLEATRDFTAVHSVSDTEKLNEMTQEWTYEWSGHFHEWQNQVSAVPFRYGRPELRIAARNGFRELIEKLWEPGTQEEPDPYAVPLLWGSRYAWFQEISERLEMPVS